MMSCWLRAGIVLVLLLQGFCDTAGVFLPALSQLPVVSDSLARREAACQCRRCGGKHCCCHPTEIPSQSAQMGALCDIPDDALTPVSLPTRAPVPAIVCILTPPAAPVRRVAPEPSHFFRDGRIPEPPLQPPSVLS